MLKAPPFWNRDRCCGSHCMSSDWIFNQLLNALLFRKCSKCSHDTKCSDVENLYRHHMWHKDLNTLKYGFLSCVSDCWFATPFKKTTFYSSIAVIHQDGGHVGTSLELAAAAGGASIYVMTEMHQTSLNCFRRVCVCVCGNNIDQLQWLFSDSPVPSCIVL